MNKESYKDEFSLIKEITKNVIVNEENITLGIGDDCAIFSSPPHIDQLISTDMMVEGIHFNEQVTEPYHIGYRLGAANISDIAAMGGVPRHMVVSIAVPHHRSSTYVEEIYKGLKDICHTYGVNIIGGDTVSIESTLVINATILGDVPKGKGLLRSGAKVGDRVFITNFLGLSFVGLQALLKGKEGYAVSKAVYQMPKAQVECGIIARELGATSLNDISDGLSSELIEISEASQVNLEIDESLLPIHAELALYGQEFDCNPYDPIWYGGEDFQLVGTISPEGAKALPKDIFTLIGHVTAGNGKVFAYQGDTKRSIAKEGYNHRRRKG